jgi:hypothetical protein
MRLGWGLGGGSVSNSDQVYANVPCSAGIDVGRKTD